MTEEEYLKYYNEIQNVDKSESDEEDTLDTLKKIGKHALISTAAALPAAYLIGGGKAVGPSLVAGGIAGTLSGAFTEDDNVSTPILAGLGMGTAVGAKEEIDHLTRMNSNKENKMVNSSESENFSKVKEFLSTYSKEGIENFSAKLHNFMVIPEIGGINAMMDAPRDEKIRYATHGTIAGSAGGLGGSLLGSLSGATAGFGAGFVSGHRLSDRLAKGLAGAVAGGTALGVSGGVLGSKLASDEAVKMLKENKAKKILRKAALNKYLTPEEKAFIQKHIESTNRERALEKAKEIVDDYEANFSESNENFAWGMNTWNLISAPFKGFNKGIKRVPRKIEADTGNWAVNHPRIASAIKLGTTGTAVEFAPMPFTGKKLVGYDDKSTSHFTYKDSPIDKAINDAKSKAVQEEMGEQFKKAAPGLAGAGLGAMVGDDPIVGGVVGGLSGFLGGEVLGKALGAEDTATKTAIGLGTSALSSYLVSKLMKKKKEKEAGIPEVNKRKVGRPKKNLENNPYDENPFYE